MPLLGCTTATTSTPPQTHGHTSATEHQTTLSALPTSRLAPTNGQSVSPSSRICRLPVPPFHHSLSPRASRMPLRVAGHSKATTPPTTPALVSPTICRATSSPTLVNTCSPLAVITRHRTTTNTLSRPNCNTPTPCTFNSTTVGPPMEQRHSACSIPLPPAIRQPLPTRCATYQFHRVDGTTAMSYCLLRQNM